MEKRNIDFIKDKDMKDTVNYTFENSLGNVITLDSAPTTAGGQLKDQQLGFDGTNLFITLSGTTYRITLTAV